MSRVNWPVRLLVRTFMLSHAGVTWLFRRAGPAPAHSGR